MAEKTCISLLQEYCQQNKHQPPSYKELPPEKGSGNSTTFTCKVQISVSKEKFEATGICLLFLFVLKMTNFNENRNWFDKKSRKTKSCQ